MVQFLHENKEINDIIKSAFELNDTRNNLKKFEMKTISNILFEIQLM